MGSRRRSRKPLQFDQFDQSITLGKHHLEQSAQLRLVLIDRQTVIRFTPIEFRIFSYLLAFPRTLVSSQELAFQAFQTKDHYDEQMHIGIIRHIYALRAKLRNSGLSIRRVVSSGWLLTDDETDEQESIRQAMI
ncbi:MAG TPA: helix-turn-helix domain-containing protein [Ktedonobacteraceae bacterium]|nr:helix-turn-helix domain-containing protein [Ktedonobacteraceae bacterium]